jgi:hypothetical protein
MHALFYTSDVLVKVTLIASWIKALGKYGINFWQSALVLVLKPVEHRQCITV